MIHTWSSLNVSRPTILPSILLHYTQEIIHLTCNVVVILSLDRSVVIDQDLVLSQYDYQRY